MVAINLAVVLAKRGQKVALIDADIDNANFGQFTNIDSEVDIIGDKFEPYIWQPEAGVYIEVFSMSMIAGRKDSISMQGDRYAQILLDVIRLSHWKADVFVIDLPGGSSDIFRAIMEEVGQYHAGNIVVAQPSMIDASYRILNLHNYMGIKVIGMIENMSYVECPECHRNINVFGPSTVEQISREFNIRNLGKIPLSTEVSNNMKNGECILPESMLLPIQTAADEVIKAEISKPSFIKRKIRAVSDSIRKGVQKTLIDLIVTAKHDVDLKAIYDEGFDEQNSVLLSITDENNKTISSVALQLVENDLKLKKDKANVDFQVAMDFRTLARIIIGKWRHENGDLYDYDAIDAWRNGDARVYGEGSTQKTIEVFRKLFTNDTLLSTMKEKAKSILQKWI